MWQVWFQIWYITLIICCFLTTGMQLGGFVSHHTRKASFWHAHMIWQCGCGTSGRRMQNLDGTRTTLSSLLVLTRAFWSRASLPALAGMHLYMYGSMALTPVLASPDNRIFFCNSVFFFLLLAMNKLIDIINWCKDHAISIDCEVVFLLSKLGNCLWSLLRERIRCPGIFFLLLLPLGTWAVEPLPRKQGRGIFVLS